MLITTTMVLKAHLHSGGAVQLPFEHPQRLQIACGKHTQGLGLRFRARFRGLLGTMCCGLSRTWQHACGVSKREDFDVADVERAVKHLSSKQRLQQSKIADEARLEFKQSAHSPALGDACGRDSRIKSSACFRVAPPCSIRKAATSATLRDCPLWQCTARQRCESEGARQLRPCSSFWFHISQKATTSAMLRDCTLWQQRTA